MKTHKANIKFLRGFYYDFCILRYIYPSMERHIKEVDLLSYEYTKIAANYPPNSDFHIKASALNKCSAILKSGDISLEELHTIIGDLNFDRMLYSKTATRLVYRDNKKSYNNFSSNPCSVKLSNIRYPRKSRSKVHWRNFYNLFPWLAERDNWDGNKSDKM